MPNHGEEHDENMAFRVTIKPCEIGYQIHSHRDCRFILTQTVWNHISGDPYNTFNVDERVC